VQEIRLRALVEELRLRPSETPWIEFKVNIIDPDKIGKIISALSNGARLLDQPQGYLLWGIDDITHDIVGTTFRPNVEKIKGHPYQFWITGQVQPSVLLQFHETYQEETGLRVVLLEIPAADRVPTKYQGRAYLRIGEATPPPSDHAGFEAALMGKLTEFSWESGVAASFVWADEVLRLLDYRTYYEQLKKPVPTTNTLILDDLTKEKLIEPDIGGRWRILNLGAVLFANHLDDFDKVKRKALRIVRYSGRSKAAAASELAIPFGYVKGYSTMIDHIHAVLPKNEEMGRALRVSIPVYPDIVVRELTANALIHQDMTVGGSGPMIDIFDDRMEITNPGAPLVDPSRFLDCPPRSRNESMASLLRRFNICEERGSGVRKVIANIEIFQLPAPDFISYENGVRVSIFAPMKFGDLDTAGRVRACYQHAALQYLSHQKMTNSSLRKRFGIGEHNAAQVSKVIAVAIEEGRILKSQPWSTRSGHYLPYWAAVS
jgi:ATP-dependent DNA helicase RecG